jgi:two-component system response regulator NreC
VRSRGLRAEVCPGRTGPEAVRSAAKGHVYIHPSVAHFLLRSFVRGGAAEDPSDPYGSLTAREREVLSLIANGLTTQQIAERLFLSPNTVHRHRTALMQKLGLHDRMELLRFCIRRGLVDPQA